MDTPQDPAFPLLTPDCVEALRPFGTERRLKAGETVWEAGTPDMAMFVVVAGEMQIVDGVSRTPIVVHGPGAFSGDIDIITGRPSVVAAVAKTDLDLVEIPGSCVRAIVNERPEAGETILRAFLLRRRALQQAGGKIGVLVVGSRFDADALRIREFLVRSRYPMSWEDLEASPDARRLLDEFGVCESDTPMVVIPHGDILRRPSTADLAKALGVVRPLDGEAVDVVVVGAGPAGLAAAVYGASEGLKTLVVDSEAPGGQAGTSSRIENYMGFPLGISGQDLADGAVAQSEKFGARIVAPVKAVSLTCADAGLHEIELTGIGTVLTRCVVLAIGAAYRKLDVDRLAEFEGRGVYYAATNVERVLCGESPVAVVGAGNSAGQAAVFMSEKARHVHLVVRGDDLRKSMSSYLAGRVEGLQRAGRLTVHLDSAVCALRGDHNLDGATLRDARTGKSQEIGLNAIFVMIGADPCTAWLKDASKVALDEKGFVLTGNDLVTRELWKLLRAPFFLETSCPGVFAVGDTRAGSVKRVASAVGEGSMAIALAHQYLAL